MYPSVHNVNSAPKTLEAEATDARLRRHKEDQDVLNRKKKDQDGHSDQHNPDNDGNVFSINALILFLEDFLETRLSSRLNQYEQPERVSVISPWVNKDISNGNEQSGGVLPNRAARAYAHGANTIKRMVRPTSYTESPEDSPNENQVHDVYHLLRDLRDLRDSGKKQLRLDGGETFLEGISKAVQIAKMDVA